MFKKIISYVDEMSEEIDFIEGNVIRFNNGYLNNVTVLTNQIIQNAKRWRCAKYICTNF